MTPAALCEGCGHTWRTAHEPSVGEEMQELINATARHKGNIVNNVALNVFSGSHKDVHKVTFTYFDTTPTEGFEDAEIIETK